MRRTLIYDTAAVDGVQELDYLTGPAIPALKRNARYYRSSSAENMRPDLTAKSFYGSEQLWWWVCFINGVISVEEDFTPGKVVTVPDFSDFTEFYRAARKR